MKNVGDIKEVNLSIKRLDKLFRIMGSNKEHVQVLKISAALEFFLIHCPDNKIDRGLDWLIEEDYTEANFLLWFHGVCQGSNLTMMKHLIGAPDRTNNFLPLGNIIVGKDWK